MKEASKVLQNTKLLSADFTSTLDNIEKNDLVFLDPPYTVSHNNNGFIKYNAKLFTEESQFRLSSFIDEIIHIGAYYILTNAAHDWIKNIFNKPNTRMLTLDRRSVIGGTNALRGKFKEFVFTNIK